MGVLGGGMIVVGFTSVAMAIMMHYLVKWPPLPPNPRASESELEEARRIGMEVQTILVPWMRRLGLAAALVGLVLIVIDLIM
jgi:hypothetical protein